MVSPEHSGAGSIMTGEASQVDLRNEIVAGSVEEMLSRF